MNNEISVVKNKQVILDESTIDQSIRLLPGLSILSFTVSILDGTNTPYISKKIELAFNNRIDKTAAIDQKVVKDANGNWSYSSIKNADEHGVVNFELNLPDPLRSDLEIDARLLGEKKYEPNQNVLRYKLNINSPDNSKDVDKLVIVSGENQFVQLGVKHQFNPLKVLVSHKSKPVNGAKVIFTIKDTRGKTGTKLHSPTTIKTLKDGTASIVPKDWTGSGLFEVTATCNKHHVVFMLMVLPAWKDLELFSPGLGRLPFQLAITPHACKVFITTAHMPEEVWPNVPCTFVSATVTEGLSITDLPKQSELIASDLKGSLPTFHVAFKTPITKTVGKMTYKALLPGDNITNKEGINNLQISA